jgi:hypothetical protein
MALLVGLWVPAGAQAQAQSHYVGVHGGFNFTTSMPPEAKTSAK